MPSTITTSVQYDCNICIYLHCIYKCITKTQGQKIREKTVLKKIGKNIFEGLKKQKTNSLLIIFI